MPVDKVKTRLTELLCSKLENDKKIEELEAEARILKKRLHLED